MLLSSPVWALILSIIFKINDIPLPNIILDTSKILGDLAIPLIMISLGIYFNPKIIRIIPLSISVFLRMVIGFSLGLLFVSLFDLKGLDQAVVLVGASAPVGYNTLTFSTLENLDTEFAASLVSVSIAAGIITVPAIIYILS